MQEKRPRDEAGGYYLPTKGTTGVLRNLNLMLRESHEARRAAILARIEQAKEARVDLDQDTDYATLEQHLADAAIHAGKRDPAAVGELLTKARACIGSVPSDPGEYVDDELLSLINVRLRAVDDLAYDRMEADVNAALVGMRGEDRVRAARDLFAAEQDFIAIAVAEVCGLETDDGPIEIRSRDGARLSDDDLDVIRRAKLTDSLFIAARNFQELPGNSQRRFGARPPETTRSSSALTAT